MERMKEDWTQEVNRKLEAQMFDAMSVEEAEGYWAAGYTSEAAAAEIAEVRK